MKLFKTKDIAQIDRYTINNEPISDIDLMERAAQEVANYLIEATDYKGKVMVFCGPGNNGGDGLAVARILANVKDRYQVEVFLLNFGKELMGASSINLNRLTDQNIVPIQILKDELPRITDDALVVDALFGSGLNRPLEGFASEVVQHINQQAKQVVAIDIPSGLMGEDNTLNSKESIIKSTLTLTFQFPKVAFLLPENDAFIGEWRVLDIKLHPHAIQSTESNYSMITDQVAQSIIKTRNKYDHKGHFGHALLIAGAYGKMGASVLASKACLRAGVGLLTTHIPHHGYPIIQTAVPEAMTSIDDSDHIFTRANELESYNAIGIGPGIGTKVNTQRGLKSLLTESQSPLVLDADALTIIGNDKTLLSLIPKGSVLTPHPKELMRLVGPSENGYQRMQKGIELASELACVLVIKGAHTMVISPDKKVGFNSTGNPGMASAGSGDVLTGIVLALLAQKYSPENAAILGVYLHGLAADIAAARRGYEALIASDIIENLGEAFKITHK